MNNLFGTAVFDIHLIVIRSRLTLSVFVKGQTANKQV